MEFLNSITAADLVAIGWPGAIVIIVAIVAVTVGKWGPYLVKAIKAYRAHTARKRAAEIQAVIKAVKRDDAEHEHTRQAACQAVVQSAIEVYLQQSVGRINTRIDDLYKENARLGVAISKISGSKIHNGGFDELVKLVKEIHDKQKKDTK